MDVFASPHETVFCVGGVEGGPSFSTSPGALRVRGGGAGGERRPPRASAALNVRPRPSGTRGRLHTTRRRRPPLDGGRRRWRCHRWRWRGGVGWAAGVAGASSDVALRRQGGALDTGPAPFPFPRPPPPKNCACSCTALGGDHEDPPSGFSFVPAPMSSLENQKRVHPTPTHPPPRHYEDDDPQPPELELDAARGDECTNAEASTR